MIRSAISVLIPIAFVAMLFSSCKTAGVATKQEDKKTSAQAPVSGEKEKIDYSYKFYNATKEKILGNVETALALFQECIKKNPNDAAAWYEVAMIYSASGKRDLAVAHSKKAVELEPRNVWYELLLADNFQRVRKYKEAAQVYETIIRYSPYRVDVYYSWADMLILAEKYDEALNVYDKMEQVAGVNEQTSMQKIKIYSSKNNFSKTELELKKLIKQYPREGKYYGMLGEIYQQKGLDDKAFETYSELLKVDPQNAFVHLSLAEYYRNKKEKDKSYNELKLAFENGELDVDTKIKILLSYYAATETGNELKGQAMELCSILVKVHPAEAKAHSMYGDFLLRDKKLKEAREEYRITNQYDKSKYPVWNQLLIIDSELNDFEAMYSEGKETIELFPTQPAAYLLFGIAATQKKKYDEAIDAFNQGLNYVVSNKPLQSQFYANLGDVYHQIDKIKESDDAYEKSLVIEPNNAYVMNNYSYYLSIRGERLERAEQMSRRSLELEPKNVSFLDTYAWILYKMANYTGAKEWMEKALSASTDASGTLFEHMGDILYQLGDKDKAVEYWEKAKAKGGATDLIDKKLADKKLYE